MFKIIHVMFVGMLLAKPVTQARVKQKGSMRKSVEHDAISVGPEWGMMLSVLAHKLTNYNSYISKPLLKTTNEKQTT